MSQTPKDAKLSNVYFPVSITSQWSACRQNKANMAHTYKKESHSSNAKKKVTDAKCSSATSSLLAAYMQRISKPKESTLSSGVHVKATPYKETGPSEAIQSNPKKTVVVPQKSGGQGESPQSGDVPGPSSSVLKNLHLDHQYLSKIEQEVAPMVSEKTVERPPIPKTATNIYSLKLPVSYSSRKNNEKSLPFTGESDKTPPLFRKSVPLQKELPGADEFLKRRMQRAMDLFQKTTEEKSKKSFCTEGLSCIPNAAAIQSNFQSALNLIAFRPISDDTGKTQALDGNIFERFDINKEKTSQQLDQSLSNSSDKCDSEAVNTDSILPGDLREEEENDSETVEKFFEAKLEYARNLMLQRWSEYLRLPREELYKIDLENAKFFNFTPDVLEMLEDKGRFVWQLIDEL